MINTIPKFIFIIFLVQVSNLLLFAQDRTTLPFLADHQSPLLIGAGSIGTALPNNDVLGFYYNPANLGYLSQSTNLAFLISPTNTKHMRYADNEQNRFALIFGYNFNKSGKGFPLSIGVGYSKYSNFGPRDKDDCFNNDFHYNNSSQTYSFGLGFNYYVDIYFGFAYKSFDAKIKVYGGWESAYMAQNSGTAFDFGTLVIIPITKLIENKYSFKISEHQITPEINLSLGYSQLNIGDEFYYIDYAQADPIPRTARTGYSINIGFETELTSNKIRVLDYSFTVEANDIPLESRAPQDNLWDHSINYQSFLGDINYWDNVLLLRPDKNVLVHKGHIITLFESLTFTFGSYSGRKEPKHTSSGFVFATKGLFKLLNSSTNNNIFKFLSNHINIEFYTANVKSTYWYTKQELSQDYKTNYKGITLALTNIQL